MTGKGIASFRVSKYRMCWLIFSVVVMFLLQNACAGTIFKGDLLKNPGFEKSRIGDKNLPACWELHQIEKKHISPQYVARNISLVKVGGKGKSLRFNLTKEVAEGPGIGFVSDMVEIDSGKRYEIKVDIKSYGPKANIFMEGFTLEEGKRERVYRATMLLEEFSGTWQTFSRMLPGKSGYAKKRFKPVKWMRVKLYAYYPEGEIFFDNVSLREY